MMFGPIFFSVERVSVSQDWSVLKSFMVGRHSRPAVPRRLIPAFETLGPIAGRFVCTASVVPNLITSPYRW